MRKHAKKKKRPEGKVERSAKTFKSAARAADFRNLLKINKLTHWQVGCPGEVGAGTAGHPPRPSGPDDLGKCQKIAIFVKISNDFVMFTIGQRVTLPQEAAAWGLTPGSPATVVEVEKGFRDMADVVTVKTDNGEPYFNREYQFQPA